MKVLVYDPYASDEAIRTAGAIRVELQDLLSRADFISLHVPLTDETRHIIGRAELERMKPSAILANTARGELIDEQALYDALVSGSIAGAGLDVFEEEPPPENHSLLGLDNVVCSPHVAGQTAEALVRTSLASAENVLRVFRGEVPDVLVNPEVLNNRSRISWNPRIIDLQQT
jgi:D-3-phosphoglycerate dehydrogenase